VKVSLHVDVPASQAAVWRALGDVPLIAACVPGAALTGQTEDGRYSGRVTTKLGPVSANFSGEAKFERDDDAYSARVVGKGRDLTTSSPVKAELGYRVLQGDNPTGSRIEIESEIVLSGVLAQFAKTAIVNDIAARIAKDFASNLSQRLNDVADAVASDAAPAQPIQAGSLLLDILAARLRSLIARVRNLLGTNATGEHSR
jgi:carbon-monoxide dehydrogenase small subunit